jgi:hypothetical protein
MRKQSSRRRQPWTPWFSLDARYAKKFNDLKYLDRPISIDLLIAFPLTLAAIIIGILAAFAIGAPDPWTRDFFSKYADPYYLIIMAFLLALTLIIAYKQYGYYYRIDGKGKEGIFVNNIRQVNYLETHMDWALAFVGALLFVFVLLPSFSWFMCLSFYSLLVVLRCFFTLSRPLFAQKQKEKGKTVTPWYEEWREPCIKTKKRGRDDDQYLVKPVLGGWILTHSVIAISSLAMGSILFVVSSHFEEPLLLFVSIAMVAVIVAEVFISGYNDWAYNTARHSERMRKYFNFLEKVASRL